MGLSVVCLLRPPAARQRLSGQQATPRRSADGQQTNTTEPPRVYHPALKEHVWSQVNFEGRPEGLGEDFQHPMLYDPVPHEASSSYLSVG